VQYQGRKTARQGSEQRRQQILDAAMRIVVRDGVRGVRHRAVAAEAGVPLSATTYYFKDIEDLLTDTFAQYVERSAAYMAKLWANTEACCASCSPRAMAARRRGRGWPTKSRA
jgi:DNA-binding transcriptional regulator YbjK